MSSSSMVNKPTRGRASRRVPVWLGAALGAALLWCLMPPAAHARDGAAANGNAPSASAAANPAARKARPAWSELTAAQQRVLAPLAGQWDTLSEVHRRKWLRIVARYQKLAPAEQQRLQARMAEWAAMTPDQRRLARENFQIHRRVPVERKTEAWDRYQQLPEAQKRQLAEAAKVPPRPGAVSALPSSRKAPPAATASAGASAGMATPASAPAALPAASGTDIGPASATAPAASFAADTASSDVIAASAAPAAASAETTSTAASSADAFESSRGP